MELEPREKILVIDSGPRYVTHESESSQYWGSRKLAERHIKLMARRGVVLDLYRELEPWKYGPGQIVASGFEIAR